MRARMLRLVSPAAILVAAAVSAGAAAATDTLPLPEEAVEIAEPAAGAAETAGRQHGDVTSDPAVAANADIDAPPESRLLRSLTERAAQPAPVSAPTRAQPAVFGPDSTAGALASGDPERSPILHGCPRALLNALLAGAADTNDAVSALAIERETLALCRERQEIVNGIVALEGELGTLLAEAQAKSAGPVEGAVGSPVSDTPIVKESAPVRVVSLPPADDDAGVAAEEKPERGPAPPSYFWFSIIGTAGDLRAGIGDGTSVWFVPEGDRLPGGTPRSSPVLVTGIGIRPPGVRIGGAGETSLPYRPRSVDASLAAGGSAALGGNAEGDGR